MNSISVVIPTFNRASQVMEAVRSVLAQTLMPLEIIVIDDGSSDDTAETLAVVRDSIRYIKTENRGVSAARNRGILEARGSWIAFLDSDDTWHPSKLQRQVQNISATGAKVCFCVSRDESGAAIDDLNAMDPELAEGADRYYSAGDCRIFKFPRHPYLQSMLARKSALMRCGMLDESLKVAEDTKLIYGLALNFGYSVVNERHVNICRDRAGPGLSDSIDAAGAYERHDCYIRVQSEAFWRLLDMDAEAAEILRTNMLYFVSRQAELACALQNPSVARRYAWVGLTFYNTWRAVCRSMIILLAYPIAERKFIKKWSGYSE